MGVLARKLLDVPSVGNITFVGGAIAGKAGGTSGTSSITLSSGLTGGSRASVQEGDLVVGILSSGATSDVSLIIQDPSSNNYTLAGSELYSNGTTYDANLRVAYKRMGASPDASTLFGASGSGIAGAVSAVVVFSGVSSSTPLDVAVVTATGTGANYPNPGAVTPITQGAVIIGVGTMTEGLGSASISNGGSWGSFYYAEGSDDDDNHLGVGVKTDWTSGEFDPAAFGGSGANASGAWAAITLVLRPGS